MAESSAFLARALEADKTDPLAPFRSRFAIPRDRSGTELTYLCGNSLGLMPVEVRRLLQEELSAWEKLAVEGHFEGPRPWYSYDEPLRAPLARLVGALEHEVVVMNGLTVNLHLLMASFYRPTKERFRIIIEDSAFPSDRYAVQSQARLHGFDPDDTVVVLRPRPGEDQLRTDDIEGYLQEHGHSVALVLMGGVNFYSGQAYEHERITKAAQAAGAMVGFDLAHAAGNLVLSLHDWGVDFAAWCSYKYLNAGPGATAGAFVHERHGDNRDLVRLAGWWGNDPATRFEMPFHFVPQRGAASWQLSNAPVLSMAPLYASLALFDEATLPALREKSERLTAFALEMLDAVPGAGERFLVLTPRDPAARGCQLSLRITHDAATLNEALAARGIICDLRRPDVIRVAPVPLYNLFEDVYRFVETFALLLDDRVA
ncbi:MAG: kynureninase [Myxococcota bacterium]